MKLGTGNRWDETAAIAAMLVFIAALLVLALRPGDSPGGEPNGPPDLKPVPIPTQTPLPVATEIATRPISTPQLLPDFDILEQRGITSLSRGDLAIAEPVSFLTRSGLTTSRLEATGQGIPPLLCVHWKIFRHNADTSEAEIVAEFFESCDEELATANEPIPERLVRLENTALREQLSFILGQLDWDEYLAISRRYAQARLARSLEALAERWPSP